MWSIENVIMDIAGLCAAVATVRAAWAIIQLQRDYRKIANRSDDRTP
jgi:hypothetical protein